MSENYDECNKNIENSQKDQSGRPAYAAHYNPQSGCYQSVETHLRETGEIISEKIELQELLNIATLTAIAHDIGKLCLSWQAYFDAKIAETYLGPKIDHSTAGGQIIEHLAPNSDLSALIQGAIYSHHGLQDFISPKDSSSLFINRLKKVETLPIKECEANFYNIFSKEELGKLKEFAQKDCEDILRHIKDVIKQWGGPGIYGNKDFFLGMYERLLISLLIDGDRRNTEDFMKSFGSPGRLETYVTCKSKADGEDLRENAVEKRGEDETSPEEKLKKFWTVCCGNVKQQIEKKGRAYDAMDKIVQFRMEISENCLRAAMWSDRILQFTVPTGAGKTLSSLLFAVNCAKEQGKKRIIYVAPFHSIIEQNAREIRKALGREDIVLEHHCNVILETEEEQSTYERLTEDWSSPVIVTSAVQLLNTLFAGKTGNVRRIHSLCDSIIIMDEVQALPVKTFEIFNMAVNFFATFANTTVVLCTATQPLLEKLPRNRILLPRQMVADFGRYQEEMRRTEILDCTEEYPGGMNIEQMGEFVLEKAKGYRKILVVVNTKRCAEKLFCHLQKLCEQDCDMSHLSTKMCPKHRKDVLELVTEGLEREKMQICVSTQLIEAGVDISFHCVIRSLAGLDSVIQAAGRCNRHMKMKLGKVFLVKLDEELENVSSISGIYKAQEAMQSVLALFRENPQELDGVLDSQKAINIYFEIFLNKNISDMCYPVTVEGTSTSIVELLSDNSKFAQREQRKQLLKQAFQTAGEKFEVIEEMGKTDLIVPYEKEAEEKIDQLEDRDVLLKEKKSILRELQQYTVSLSGKELEKVKGGIRERWNGQLLVLDKRYYDEKLGVIEEPKMKDN